MGIVGAWACGDSDWSAPGCGACQWRRPEGTAQIGEIAMMPVSWPLCARSISCVTDRPASSQNVHFAGRVQGRSGHCFFRLEPSSRGLVPGRLARTHQFLSPAWSQGFSQDGQAHASLSLRGSSRTTIPVAKACKATFPPCLLPWRLALLCTKAISPIMDVVAWQVAKILRRRLVLPDTMNCPSLRQPPQRTQDAREGRWAGF